MCKQGGVQSFRKNPTKCAFICGPKMHHCVCFCGDNLQVSPEGPKTLVGATEIYKHKVRVAVFVTSQQEDEKGGGGNGGGEQRKGGGVFH